jgi:predicted amino acid-binding ACT domain protein
MNAIARIAAAAGINIVSIHQHMTQETPRIMFLHYWGKGRASDLAIAVRQALDSQHARN